MTPQDTALVDLGVALRYVGYRHTAVSPGTLRKLEARPIVDGARSLVDVFGCNRPFRRDSISGKIVALLETADALVQRDGLYRSKVRFATLGTGVFAFPASSDTTPEAVPFGADTYRYAAAIARTARIAARGVETYCGAAAGALSVASRFKRVTLSDPDPRALRFARINAAINDVKNADFVEGDLAAAFDATGAADLVMANVPFMVDDYERIGRKGAAPPCTDLVTAIFDGAMERLTTGGRVLLCSGSAIVNGEDTLLAALTPHIAAAASAHEYSELEVDVYGEELERVEYLAVDRFSAVSLVATRA